MTGPVLEVEDVCVRHWRGARCRQVLDHLSLRLEAGELGGIWADRSAGKSTLLGVIAGTVRPDSGRMRLAGRDVARARAELHPLVALADRRGPASPDVTVMDWVAQTMLAQHPWPIARREAQTALDRLGVRDVGAERWSDLADNERALTAIAAAIARRPRLVLVDDLAADLGAWQREAVLAFLHAVKADGTTVLMTSTDASDLKGADRLWSLEAGRLLQSAGPTCAEIVPLRRVGTSRSR